MFSLRGLPAAADACGEATQPGSPLEPFRARGVPWLILLLCYPWPLLSQATQFRLYPAAGTERETTFVTHAGDGSGILFVGWRKGDIRRLLPNDTPPAGMRTFLSTIEDRVSCCGERGLLGVAFPPGYETKRHFYVYYTDRAGDLAVSRFRLYPVNFADLGSEEVILRISHREHSNNNGGAFAFGPDGYLYIGTGDGGGDGDPAGNAQNRMSLLGKILRIDVEGPAQPYAIPPDNPFPSRSDTRPEIWALGLRNPQRFSFDRQTGELYIAESGARFEEIDHQPASAGGANYGWPLMEGFECRLGGCSPAGLTVPVHAYGHVEGDCSVVGGDVYRYVAPSLQRTYLYGDACTGRIWGLRREGGQWRNTLLADTDLGISAFGQDERGKFYVADRSAGLHFLSEGAPRIDFGGVVDSASYRPALAPGGLGSVFGSDFVTELQTDFQVTQASEFPLPTELSGVRVLVNGVEAPVLAVASRWSPVTGQVNFQVPWETALGRAEVVVEAGGLRSGSAEVDVRPAAWAVFAAVSSSYGSLLQCTYYGTWYRFCPAISPGQIMLVFATGHGEVTNPPPTGMPALASPLSHTVETPVVQVGGKDTRVLFSGLAPTLVGVYQINVEVPQGVPAGEVDVVVGYGQSSAPVKVRIAN